MDSEGYMTHFRLHEKNYRIRLHFQIFVFRFFNAFKWSFSEIMVSRFDESSNVRLEKRKQRKNLYC